MNGQGLGPCLALGELRRAHDALFDLLMVSGELAGLASGIEVARFAILGALGEAKDLSIKPENTADFCRAAIDSLDRLVTQADRCGGRVKGVEERLRTILGDER